MARRRLDLLTRRRILPDASVDFINHFDDAVDRVNYATGAIALSHPTPNTGLIVGVYGKRQGATAGTTNGIASVTASGGSGRVYNCIPLHGGIQAPFGRINQMWGASILNETACTLLVTFTNTQDRCTLVFWEVMGIQTLNPYDSVAVPGAPPGPAVGDISTDVDIQSGAVVCGYVVANLSTGFIWGGLTEELEVALAADHSIGAASIAVGTALSTFLPLNVDCTGAPDGTIYSAVSLR